jgi:hypothetical protein
MPVTCDTHAAYVQYELGTGSRLPTFVTADKDWSVALWIRPAPTLIDGSIFQLTHAASPERSALHITTNNGGRDVQARVYDGAGTLITSTTTMDVPDNQRPISTSFESWTLVIVSFDNITGLQSELSIRAINAAGRAYAPPAGVFNPMDSPLAPFNRVRIGRASLAGSNGVAGAFGPVVVRAHATSPADATRLWGTKQISAPVAYEGGTWNGDPGAVWGTFHAMCSHPSDRDGAVGTPGLPAEFSDASTLTPSNTCVFDRGMAGATWLDAHSARTTIVGNWAISLPDPFFHLARPMFPGIPPSKSVADRAPVLAALARGVDIGLKRVLVTGNSRATRFLSDTRADVGPWPQNWSSGLALARLDHVCGTFNVYPTANPGSVEFGADLLDAPRASFRANTIVTDRALRRFSYGSQRNGDTLPNGDMLGGPGGGVLVRPDGYYQSLTRQVPGSRYLWSKDRVYSALMLAYPGSCGAQIFLRSSNTSLADADAETRASGDRASLDTTRINATIVASDQMQRTITLAGVGLGIQVGDAISTFNSTTTWDVSIIASVAENATHTTVTLEHWFDPAIMTNPGRTVRIGAWEYRWLRVVAQAGHEWSDDLYQGLRVEAESGVGTGPACLLTEEWYALTDGYLFGSGGWSAHGYDDQLQSAFTTIRSSDGLSPFHAFIRAIEPHSVLMTPAQQSDVAQSLGPMTEAIRAALGQDAEIVWVADNAHGRSTALALDYGWLDQDYASWYEWMADNAKEYRVPFLAGGISSQGSFAEQYARGWRSDSCAHATSEGNRVWAMAVLHDARLTLPLLLRGPLQHRQPSAGAAGPP